MKVLGLDLGSSCGWAVLDGSKRQASGCCRLLPPPARRIHDGQRWLNFDRLLGSLIKTHNPDLIAYERVRRHIGTGAAHVYGGWLAMLEMHQTHRLLRGELLIPVQSIEVGTWKQLTMGNGKGRATKQEIREAMDLLFSIKTQTEDEADALGIALGVVYQLRTGAAVVP